MTHWRLVVGSKGLIDLEQSVTRREKHPVNSGCVLEWGLDPEAVVGEVAACRLALAGALRGLLSVSVGQHFLIPNYNENNAAPS